jgi:hypothetical protein
MSGSSTAISAMLSGETSFITIAGSGIINAHLAGSDAVMIAGTVNYAPYELVVAKDISKMEDLKGKKLGIARFGGSADFLARWALEKYGLKPGKDVIVLQTGGNPERLAALERFRRLCWSSPLLTTRRRKDSKLFWIIRKSDSTISTAGSARQNLTSKKITTVRFVFSKVWSKEFTA